MFTLTVWTFVCFWDVGVVRPTGARVVCRVPPTLVQLCTSESGDVDVLHCSDSDGLCGTDVSEARLGGWLGDSDGFSTDVSDKRRKRRRAGDQGES